MNISPFWITKKKWCRMWLTYLHDDDITCQCNVIFKDCNCENLGELKKSKNCKTDFQDSILNHTQPVLGEGYNQNFPMLLSLEIVPLIQAIGQWINFSSWCMTLFLSPARFLVASYADVLRLVTNDDFVGRNSLLAAGFFSKGHLDARA